MGIETDHTSEEIPMGNAMASVAPDSELRDDEAVAHALRDLLDPW